MRWVTAARRSSITITIKTRSKKGSFAEPFFLSHSQGDGILREGRTVLTKAVRSYARAAFVIRSRTLMARKRTEPMETQTAGGGPNIASPMATAPIKSPKAPRSGRSFISRSKADAARRKSLKKQRSQLVGSQVRRREHCGLFGGGLARS
jgi:hypothetical protein